MTLRTSLTLLLAAALLAPATGCTPQQTTTPNDGARVALSAAESGGGHPLVLAAGDTLGLELHLAGAR